MGRVNSWARLVGLLKGGPIEAHTESGRSRERWRRIVLGAAGAGGYRAVSMAGVLITVPLIIRYAGQERYGLFALVTTFASLLAFSDLGLGNGLITALSAAHGRGATSTEMRRLISSATFLLMAVMGLLGAVAVVLVAVLPWPRVVGAPAVVSSDVRSSVAVFALLFLLGLPVSVAQKVHWGLQEGLTANLWLTLGAVLTILGLLVCVSARLPVPYLVAASTGGVTVSGLLNCLVLFVFRRPELRPSWRLVDRTAVRGLAVTGWLFFVLGAAGAIAYQTDALIVSSILGVGAVTTYNVPLRLMTLPGLLVSFVLTPLWPAYSEALARGDHRWLARTFRRSVFVASIVNIPTALLLLVFGRYAIHVWVGRQVSPPVLLLLALAAWTILNSLQGPIAMLLNGLSVVRFQVICAVSMAAANLAISIALTHRFGVAGPVVGTVVAQTLFITVPSVVYLRKRWRTMRRITRAVVEVAR